MQKDNTELIEQFLQGRDPMEKIISIECGFDDNEVKMIYINKLGKKCLCKDDFKPFVWAKHSVCDRMFNGDRSMVKKKLKEFGIEVKLLQTTSESKEPNERLTNGYKYMFFARRKMSYQRFQQFFQLANTPIYENKRKKDKNAKEGGSSKEFLAVTPVEQYMISTGRRLFKFYENYDELTRLLFDLETEGLNPEIHSIDQIGIRTNKGFEKVITITGETSLERRVNELAAIKEFLEILREQKPDVIAGHNSEVFDWQFIETRCKVLGTSLETLSTEVGYKNPIYKKKKETVLKLGGEVEYYKPTIIWGHNVLDSLHAVRRAQAIDSNMKSANLKYVTKYLGLKKENRVYVHGQQISTIWRDIEPNYALNDTNGDWYKITETKPIKEGYEAVSGKYIVERYLLDDIWETDKVELALNEANFLIGKLLPTPFQRACTMGTASIWKLIMLGWCFENNLAIPSFAPSKSFTGGLSRLLILGYVDNVVKLDYNSLYPSIDLTWNVSSSLDITDSMLSFLNYILTQREKYKELKAVAGGKCKKLKAMIDEAIANGASDEEIKKLKEEKQKWEVEKSSNDKKQLPLKILANSFFGSYGSPNIFPFGDVVCAEKTTCIGRMSLRLMISHFSNIGYTPIVGDTDGFNFQMPKSFRYTDENPYIGKGLGRNVVEGKKYTLVDADVAEFEDLYLNQAWNGGINKMGLGVDEYCDATINFSRKNYADLLENGKTKKVGNTIKSRRMSGYIEKFLEVGIDQLLNGQGQEFLEGYYEYIDKIYNYKIPLRDIASKGKIKKTLAEYIADCNTFTKSGSKKSRQAWYELAIQSDLKVNLDDTLYYVNCGSKKSESDVKRVTHQYVKYNNEETELTSKIKRELLLVECEKLNIEYKTLKEKDKKKLLAPLIVREEDEIILNCKLVPSEIVEAEDDIMCNDEIEYNVVKYIEQFNSRIKPLLVCFSKDIRDQILIQNPEERPYFTVEQCKLVSGEPNEEKDQDTYEQLMKPERKEIAFWLSINEEPPFVKECGIDWDKLVAEYQDIKAREEDALFKDLDAQYNKMLCGLSKEDIVKFNNDGDIPKSLHDIVFLNSEDMCFYFHQLPNMTPSTGGNIFDDIQLQDVSEVEYEEFLSSVYE